MPNCGQSKSYGLMTRTLSRRRRYHGIVRAYRPIVFWIDARRKSALESPDGVHACIGYYLPSASQLPTVYPIRIKVVLQTPVCMMPVVLCTEACYSCKRSVLRAFGEPGIKLLWYCHISAERLEILNSRKFDLRPHDDIADIIMHGARFMIAEIFALYRSTI